MMGNTDDDKHIAAESLLSLVDLSNQVSPSGNDDCTESKFGGNQSDKTRASLTQCVNPPVIFEESPGTTAPARAVSTSSFSSGGDEPSQGQGHHQSSENTKCDGVVPHRHRRSNPVTANRMTFPSLSCETKPLPQTLMEILTNQDYQEMMSFLPDNMTFMVVNNKRFLKEVMPRHFQEDEFSSFLKKLEQYGFIHAQVNKYQHVFSHPKFIKNDWVLLQGVQCNSTIAANNNTSRQPLRKRTVENTIDDYPEQVKVPKFSHTESSFALDLRSSIVEQLELSRQLKAELIMNKLQDYSTHSSFPNASSPYDTAVAMMAENDEVHDVAKDVLAQAIDCLLHDEDHTIELLARRGADLHNTRRLSL